MIKRTSLSFACLSFFYLSTISILQANETDTLQFRRFTFSDREIQFVLDPASLITAQNIVLSNLQSNGTGACTISGNTQTQIFSNSVNTTADSGGAFDMVTTSFTASDNANLLFCNNYCTHNKGGGAIRSGGPIRFLNNQDVLFYNNISAGAKYVGTGDHNEKNRGGALYATTITLTGNRTLAFINNMSGDCGGAISADTQISITDTVKGILFENNHTLNHIPYTQAENMARGGAICSRRDLCSISNNSGPIVFNYNQGGKGGAISATRCVIDNNKERIIFSNNSSLGWSQSSSASNGGAIQTTQGFTLRNNKGSIYFDSNTATHAGGAINCGYIDIRDNGPVYFLNNSAAWGAAFNLSKPRSATNYIHTGTGDIVFNNNVVFTLDGNLLGKRKLFHINNNEITP